MQVKQTLIAARALIADPKNWIQGTYARDSSGNEVTTDDPNATCFCSVGALQHVATDLLFYSKVFYLLNVAVGGSPIYFNDNHTHAEVLAAWDKAIEMAED